MHAVPHTRDTRVCWVCECASLRENPIVWRSRRGGVGGFKSSGGGGGGGRWWTVVAGRNRIAIGRVCLICLCVGTRRRPRGEAHGKRRNNTRVNQPRYQQSSYRLRYTHTHTLANTLRSTTRLTTRPTTTKKTKQMKTADGSPKSSLRGDPKLIRLTCWRSTFHFFGCLAGTREVGVGWAAGGGPSGQGGPVAPLRRPQPSRKRKSLAAAKKLVAGQVDKRRSKEKKKKKNATFSLPSNPISTSNDKV